MPYIDWEERVQILAGRHPDMVGELNYALTAVIRTYLEDKGTCYQTINDILGALEGCKLEFYRRVAVPREQEVCYNVGDVYTKPEEGVPSVWWEEAQGQGQEVLRRLSRQSAEESNSEQS